MTINRIFIISVVKLLMSIYVLRILIAWSVVVWLLLYYSEAIVQFVSEQKGMHEREKEIDTWKAPTP